jgi:hypothetical protein
MAIELSCSAILFAWILSNPRLVKFYYAGIAVKTKSMIIIINSMTNLNLKFKLLASKRAFLRPIKILQGPDKLTAAAVN